LNIGVKGKRGHAPLVPDRRPVDVGPTQFSVRIKAFALNLVRSPEIYLGDEWLVWGEHPRWLWFVPPGLAQPAGGLTEGVASCVLGRSRHIAARHE
jgi:hypothetical protein